MGVKPAILQNVRIAAATFVLAAVAWCLHASPASASLVINPIAEDFKLNSLDFAAPSEASMGSCGQRKVDPADDAPRRVDRQLPTSVAFGNHQHSDGTTTSTSSTSGASGQNGPTAIVSRIPLEAGNGQGVTSSLVAQGKVHLPMPPGTRLLRPPQLSSDFCV